MDAAGARYMAPAPHSLASGLPAHGRRRRSLLLFLPLLGAASGMKVREGEEPSLQMAAEHCKSPANEILRENCLPGSPSSEWDINGAGAASIQGFATEASYAPGQRVDFKVKTDSTAYRFDIYRLGWYAGLGARRLASFRPSAPLPQRQPPCHVEEETLLVDCATWAVSGSWQVPEEAVTGVYFARLVREDPPPHWRSDASEIAPSPKFANRAWDYSKMPPCGDAETCQGLEHAYGAQRLKKGPAAMLRNALKEPSASHVYFVVRQDRRRTDLLLQTIDATWHAYNNYAAPSTYGVMPLPRHNFSIPASWDGRRAYKVSYNVPLVVRDTRAVNAVFNAEFPAIRWLEKHGYDVQYWSGLDAHARGSEIARRARAYVSAGHDEYWSGEQRDHVEAARDEGVHLLFWSGNEVYWKVRWESSPVDGHPLRTMVIYKESQESIKIDPDPAVWTGTFRDGREINPQGARPENALTGTIFTVNAWRSDPLEVPGAYAPLRIWRDTPVAALGANQTAVLLKGLLGHEWDEDLDNGFRPAGLIRLSETTVDNVQYIVDTGGCFDSGSATHHLVMYKAASGALVFGAGTVQWTWGLDNFHDEVTGGNNMLENEYDTRVGVDTAGPEPVVQQATANVLADMDVQPALLGWGLVRPSPSTDTAPPIVEEMKAEQGVLTARARDEGGGVVASVEWSADGERWHPMLRAQGDASLWQAAAEVGAFWARAVDDSLNLGAVERHPRLGSAALHREL